MDCDYTSPQLANMLLEISTTITGTVMVSKRGMPAATKEKSKKKNEDESTYTNGPLVVAQWTDKRTLPHSPRSMATKWSLFHQDRKNDG